MANLIPSRTIVFLSGNHIKTSIMKQKINLMLAFLIVVQASRGQHPFKYDNTVYKAVFLVEAFQAMDTLSNYLLLDVRSPGEYADTSKSTALNIGHIKGSKNITIDSVPAHLPELKKYINRPVFVYCSHSQRSRRVSKLLAENGFKQVYNINGGMTLFNELDDAEFPEKSKLLVTNLVYKNLNSVDAYQLVENTPELVIIDIRTAREFENKDSLQKNNIGRLKNAVNIPQEEFAEKIDARKIPKTSPILLYDLYGFNSMDVVDILRAKGYSRIYNLFDGLSGFISDSRLGKSKIRKTVIYAPAYQLLDPKACIDLLKDQSGLLILDARPADEFNNRAAMSHMNLGHIRGAIPVSSLEKLQGLVKGKDKSAPILVYGSGDDLAAVVCRELVNKGFHQVNLLTPGLYRFVWATANIENCRAGRDYLADHEGLY
jgi:rhodanese-related sulfurtransferase